MGAASMGLGGGGRRTREERVGLERGLWFAAGLALSVAFHVWAWRELPKLQVGEMTLRDLSSRDAPIETRVWDVERQPRPEVYESVERFRPEDPDTLAAVEARQTELLGEWMEDVAADYEAPPPVPGGVPPGGEVPDDPPSPEEVATAFREEILAIEERKAAAELASLPRRLVPTEGRVQGTPDITLAADPAEVAAAYAAAAAAQGGEQAGWKKRGGRGGTGDALDAAVPEDAPEVGAAAPDERVAEAVVAEAASPDELATVQAAALDETREEVTEVAPVEELLRLQTDTWADTAEGWLYFQVEVARAGEAALPVLSKDVLLLLDRSYSINPSKFDYFKEGLVEFIKTLRQGDRLNVMRYSEDFELCFPDWTEATGDSLTAAAQFVRDTKRGGKTDLYGSLRHVLDIPRDTRRPLLVVLLTDGRATAGVLENSDIISRFSRLNHGGVSVFTVGAGENVNRFLLDMLGQFNRGGTVYREDRAQLPDALKQVARGLSRPVLLNLRWRLSSGAEAEVFPADLTHLYLDRPLRLTGRCPLSSAGAVLRVEGESNGREFDMVFPLDWDEASNGGEGLRREWVAQKIYSLLHDDLESKNPATQAEIRRLAAQYRVPLP